LPHDCPLCNDRLSDSSNNNNNSKDIGRVPGLQRDTLRANAAALIVEFVGLSVSLFVQ